ncbi:MAG: ABC transporter ATP-binding protein [candidate division WOR-3 bacterium]
MTLQFKKVSYRYPRTDAWAIRDLDLIIHRDECVLVAGTSGSGKSTLCRASIGLVPHFHQGELIGRVLLDGFDTRQHPVHQLVRHAGLVFQNPDAQLFNHTVEAELAYGLESLGFSPSEIEERLNWVRERLTLGSLMKRSPYALSGGEKQRVALGAILALRPKILLLDEPFTHLDPEGAEQLRFTLRSIQSEGITLIIVEHRLHEIITDVNRLIVLHQGEAKMDGPPHQVIAGDISTYGLNLPPLVRIFRELGWGETPFSVEEAVREMDANHLSPKIFLDFQEKNPPAAAPCPSGSDPVIEAEDLWFHYKDCPVLCGIDLKLRRGECVALIGRNGAGKTTLVKHLNGLLKPDRGWLKVLGRDTRQTPVSKLARYVGFAWQNPNDQLFRPTVREEVLTGPRVLGAYDPVWCDRLFERLGLGPLLDRSPFSLSEGQKKRVSFAAALATQPELIVLDEPTAGQDDPSRRELAELIYELQREGRTIVLVTHDLEFAARYAKRWLILTEGKIIADGSPDALMANHAAMTKAGLRPTQRFQLIQALRQLPKE